MNMLKRIFATILSVAIILSVVPFAVFATANTTVTVDSVTTALNPGDSFTLSVSVSDNAGFADFTGEVVYDSNVLTPASPFITIGSAVPGHMTLVANDKFNLNTATDNVTVNGEILVLHFVVNADTTAGNTSVSVKLQNDSENNFTNIDGDPVNVSFVQGTVLIKCKKAFYVGDAGYDLFSEALAAVADGGTIKMGKDFVPNPNSNIADNAYFNVLTNRTVVLDLNGYNIGLSTSTISTNGVLQVNAGADLTIINTSDKLSTIDNGAKVTCFLTTTGKITVDSENVLIQNSFSRTGNSIFRSQGNTNTLKLKNGTFPGTVIAGTVNLTVEGGKFTDDPSAYVDSTKYTVSQDGGYYVVSVKSHSHTWGDVVYSWNNDNTACTATRTCTADASHVETAEAQITSEITKAATLTSVGEHTYTATFDEEWASTQTKTVADIPMLSAVCEANGIQYASLADAVAANTSLDDTYVITLIRDCDEETVSYGIFGTLDLSGHTITTLNFNSVTTGTVIKSNWYILAGYYENGIGGIRNGTITNLNLSSNASKKTEITTSDNLTIGTLSCFGNSCFDLSGENSYVEQIICNEVTQPSLIGKESIAVANEFVINSVQFNSVGERLKIYGGTINSLELSGTATCVIYTGTYGFDPTAYLNSDTTYDYFVDPAEGGKYVAYRIPKPLFVIDSTNYKSMADALAALKPGQVIKLGTFDASSKTITIDTSLTDVEEVIFDMNGHSIGGSGISLARLIVTGGGKVKLINTGAAASISSKSQSSVVTLKGGSILTIDAANVTFQNYYQTASSQILFYHSTSESGSVVISNGVFNSILTFAEGTNKNCTMTLLGGSYKLDPSEYLDLDNYHAIKNLVSDYYEVGAHVWGDGVVTTPATFEADGLKTFTCTCGAEKTEVIPKKIAIVGVYDSWEEEFLGYYETIDEAMNNAFRVGTEIRLLCNVDEATITYGRFDKFDLQGHTIGTLNIVGRAYETGLDNAYSIIAGDQYDGICNGTITNLICNPVEGSKLVSLYIGYDITVTNMVCYGISSFTTTRYSNAVIGTLTYNSISNPFINGNPIISTLKIDAVNASGVSITGGNIGTLLVANGCKVLISGGSFGTDPSAYLAPATTAYHYETVKSGDIWNVVKVNEPVFVLNGVNYDTIGNAMSAAKEGDTIVLGSAYTSDVTLVFSKNVTIDLNGHNVGPGKYTYSNVISVNSKVQAKIINTGAPATIQTNSAEYAIELNKSSVTIDSENITLLSTGAGTLFGPFFDMANYAGSVIINNATIPSDNFGIYTSLTINGGHFGFDPSNYVNSSISHIKKNLITDMWDVAPHHVVLDKAIPATTIASGATEGRHCDICGNILVAQTVIPMLVSENEDEAKVEIAVEDGATEVSSDIPNEIFNQKTENEEQKSVSIDVGTVANVTFDAEAAQSILGNAGDSSISIEFGVKTAEESSELVEEVALADVTKVISISLKDENGDDLFNSTNASGSVTVSVPYIPSNSDAAILVFYVNGNEKTLVPVHYENGVLVLTLSHFSDYVICEHDSHTYVDHFCTECGEFDSSLKFFLSVVSGNAVTLAVGDDYNAVVKLPDNSYVNTQSITISAIMQNVSSLGVTGVREHSVTVNTGFGSSEVNLQSWLSNAYAFGGGVVNVTIDGHAVTYTINAIDGRNGNLFR